jgi:site-specific DNA recombinase
MNALKPLAPFQALVMSEESRLGREALETAYALKQIVQAGVQVWFHLENRQRTLDSPTDKIMLSLTAFAAESEREKARRTYDAMLRKARAGHVTGGRLFGYDQLPIMAPDGRRSHVERRISEHEAAVVREIFERCARGEGLKTIAKALNVCGALSPRPQQGRPRSWAPSSVREVLYRDTYRGLIVWNHTRKRNAWGQVCQSDRPATEWITVPAGHLQIVPEALWQAAHGRMGNRRKRYEAWRRHPSAGEPDGRGVRKHYFLTGSCRCANCHGSIQAVSRASTAGRIFRYICGTYWNRGASACDIGRMADMAVADHECRRSSETA